MIKFILLLVGSILINPISIGLLVGFLSSFFPDVGTIRWSAPKIGPVYFDEMFKAGFITGLLAIAYLLYRYRKFLGEQAVLFVCFIQLLMLIIPAVIKIKDLQYVLDEMNRYPNLFQNQDHLWIKIGWVVVSLLSCCALLVLSKLLYNLWQKEAN